MSTKHLKNNSEKRGRFLTNLKTHLLRQRLGELLVVGGLISPQTLKTALHTQKQTNRPLGKLLVEDGIISKWQLISTLFKQQALKLTTGMLFFVASLSFNAPKTYADLIPDVPARISLTSAANTVFSSLQTTPTVFQSIETRSSDISAFTKWSGMFERFDKELKNGKNNQALQTWRTKLSAFQNSSLKDMAAQVNDLANEVRYIEDSENWGKSDYWATPVEFLTRGGDCEDFAIAKYTALRALGVPEDRLRVAIVHDTLKDIAHSVLIVYTESGPYLLDNQVKTLIDAQDSGRYRPIYSINRTAWWLHTPPEATVVASAY